jgi:hypothetical protein
MVDKEDVGENGRRETQSVSPGKCLTTLVDCHSIRLSTVSVESIGSSSRNVKANPITFTFHSYST